MISLTRIHSSFHWNRAASKAVGLLRIGIELSIRSATREGDYYQIRIAVAFDEVVPTSCGDIQMSNSVHGEMELTVDRETGEIEFCAGDE
jgi:hypothetical protein